MKSLTKLGLMIGLVVVGQVQGAVLKQGEGFLKPQQNLA